MDIDTRSPLGLQSAFGSDSAHSSVTGERLKPVEETYVVDCVTARDAATAACRKNYDPAIFGNEALWEGVVREAQNISTAAVAASYYAYLENEGDIEAARTVASEQSSALTGICSTAYLFGIEAFFTALTSPLMVEVAIHE
jgi:hypothetical protein